jgi:5-methylthioadenosine/S-adenosylhomocysteine deaminase
MVAEPGRRECDVVIRHGYVITMNPDRTVYADGAVAIAGREIVLVGPDQEVAAAWRGHQTIDAHGAPVHPGFVDAHWHNCNETTRGVFPDVATTKEYYKYYAAWYDLMDPADEYASAQLSGVEMLRSGVTCFMEPGTAFDTAAVADAVVGVGIRASLCEPFLWDISDDPMLGSMRRAPGTAQRCGELLGRELWRNSADGLVRGHIGVFGSGTASDGLLHDACDFAQRSGVIFTQHQSSTLHGIGGQEARMGEMPLVHFGRLDLLKPHCSFAHMTWIRDEEARFVRESGMSIVWSPAISMNWGWAKGFARSHPRLFRDGVNVGLGSDVPKFGLDTAAMVAYLISREQGDPEPLLAEEVFEMATLGGARAMGLNARIGSLEAGKLADVVVRTTELPEFQPGHYPVQNVLLASRGRSVDTVLVDGQVVVRSGHSTRVDERAVCRAARESADRLAERIGIPANGSWPVVG